MVLVAASIPDSYADDSKVHSLVLVDASRNRDIKVLEEGETINLATLETRRLNIRAEIEGGPVREVVFGVNRDNRYRSETSAPYSLAGDVGGRYNAWNIRPGKYEIRVRANPARKGDDSTLRLNLTVVDDPTASKVALNPASPRPEDSARAALKAEGLPSQPQVNPTPPSSIEANGPFMLRINCGGSALTDHDGRSWESDAKYSSAAQFGNGSSVYDPLGLAIYQSGRDSSVKPLKYAIPLENGVYSVNFHFMELYLASPGKRIFNVFAEQLPVITDLDIVAVAGAYRTYTVSRTVIVTDKILNLDFVPTVGYASVNGLEIQRVSR